MQRDLDVLPVAGVEFGFEPNPVPDAAGNLRVETAVRHCRQGNTQAVAVIGGVRPMGNGDAYWYAESFRRKSPGSECRLRIVDASATNTIRDIIAALGKIDDYLESVGKVRCSAVVGVVSYGWHARRARIVLRRNGFRHVEIINSGEKSAYPVAIELMLLAVTWLDSGWRWLGLPFNWYSRRRFERTAP